MAHDEEQPERQPGEITQLLASWRRGDRGAFDRLLPLVYNELRALAGGYMARERRGMTLEPTGLVHEAYLRLSKIGELEAHDRSHFFATAAQAMRRILVEQARAQHAHKRVGAHRKRPLDDALHMPTHEPDRVLAVHDALRTFATRHPRPAQLVELRYFGGFSEGEAAEILDVSRATISRDWRFAKLWLYKHLQDS